MPQWILLNVPFICVLDNVQLVKKTPHSAVSENHLLLYIQNQGINPIKFISSGSQKTGRNLSELRIILYNSVLPIVLLLKSGKVRIGSHFTTFIDNSRILSEEEYTVAHGE